MKKIWLWALIITLLASVALIYGRILPQNNDEQLFLGKDLKRQFVTYGKIFDWGEQLLIHFEFKSPPISGEEEKLLSKVKSVFEKNSIELWTSPQDLTKKVKLSDWNQFYLDHPNLSPKLATDRSFIITTILPEMNEQQLNVFIQEIEQIDQGVSISIMGAPYINYYLNEMGQSAQEFLVPVVLALTFLFNFIYYRTLWASFFSFITSLLGLGIGMVTLKILYGEANIITSSVPLINFVVIQSLNFHFLSGLMTYEKIERVIEKKFKPMLLMALATTIGFLSLSTSEMEAIDQFSFASTISQVLATISVCSVWYFAFKGVFIPKRKLPHFLFLFSPTWLKREIALAITIGVIGLGIFSYFKLPVLVEAFYFFPKEHKLRTDFTKIEKIVGGSPHLDLIIGPTEITAQSIREISVIEEKLKTNLSPIFSNLQIWGPGKALKDANYIYTQQLQLPENDQALFALLSQVPQTLKNGLMQDDYFRLSINIPSLTSEEYDIFLKKVRENIVTLGPNYKIDLSGMYFTLHSSQKELINSLLSGLLSSIAIICIIVGLTFKSIESFIHFLMVNLAPLGCATSMLWLLGMDLHVGTIKIFSISFGMMVDSTIHLIFGIKQYGEHAEKNKEFCQSTIVPIYLSTVITIISFLVFGFHEFMPIRQFGTFLGLVLLCGLIFDVSVYPRIEKAGHNGPSH